MTGLPDSHLRRQLEQLPAGLPALLVIGANVISFAAAYTGEPEIIGGVDQAPATIALPIMLPACSCTDPDEDVDPDCARHYPRPPAEFVDVIAKAIAAGRLWELGGRGHANPVDGVDEQNVNAALAVCEVLFRAGRNGVLR